MNSDYKELLPADFAGDSRVWIYQSPRLFMISEALEIEEMLENFVREWHTHGAPVKGHANLLYGQFIVVMADESASGVSGCSTDSMVRVIKEIEKKFNTPLFDRLNLAFFIKEKVQMVPMAQLPYALENGFVDENALYFNNTVLTKAELEAKWIIPVKNSWLAGKYLRGKETAGAEK
ncbi:MAG TPA: hypothetical protein VNS58_02810 [Puia sp.]|nr:hypothetical protein [Puia sp.]